MMLRLFSLLALCLAFSQGAAACAYERMQFEVALKSSEKAFIGTVETVENRLAILKVEKAVKGVKEGETLDVEIGESSCAIRFQAGQRWLYLGASQPSGSILLRDENGNAMAENLRLVQEKLGDTPEADRDIVGGTLKRSCAPWDGTAYTITLDNGITASVYASINDLEHMDRNTAATFPVDGKSEPGHGHMLHCPKLTGDKATDIPCQLREGTITIGPVDSLTAAGRLDIKDGEHSIRHVFKVKRVEKQVFCG